jgi:hypothetical protein
VLPTVDNIGAVYIIEGAADTVVFWLQPLLFWRIILVSVVEHDPAQHVL